jgi:hypothetical protein
MRRTFGEDGCGTPYVASNQSDGGLLRRKWALTTQRDVRAHLVVSSSLARVTCRMSNAAIQTLLLL